MIARRPLIGGLLASLSARRIARAQTASTADLANRLANDPRRPQYHLLPRSGYVNDPNGPIQYRGETHLFYQQTPNPTGEGNQKEWGHAVSSDMLHWRHLPTAIVPTPGGPGKDGAWTGCCVIDGETPTIVYTGVWPEVQCLATSKDGMLTWEKRSEPVLSLPPSGMKVLGWRDPMIWREDDHWSMILGSGEQDVGPTVLLYHSADLRQWNYIGKLYHETRYPDGHAPQAAHGMVFECPDFFPLGDKHVLLHSSPGMGARYHVGSYDGTTFHPEHSGILDYGDYYAPRSMLNGSGKRILWGWVTETRTAQQRTEQGWSGAISLPRELSLGPDGDLAIRPAAEVSGLRGNRLSATAASQSSTQLSWQLDEACVEVAVRARNWLFLSFQGRAGYVYANVAFDTVTDTLFIGNAVAPLRLGEDRMIDMRIFIDGSVWEVYVNDYLCITLRRFDVPSGPMWLVVKLTDLPAIVSLDMWPIIPISPNRLTT